MNCIVIDSPVGKILISEENSMIVGLSFCDSNPAVPCCETPVLTEAKKQISEYFDCKRKEFSLPVRLSGSEYCLSVWKALQNIPYGSTKCYSEIAALTGNPNSARAVGTACHRNPIAIIIPCHRVIGKNGQITGFAGGLSVKEQLLLLEGHSNEKE